MMLIRLFLNVPINKNYLILKTSHCDLTIMTKIVLVLLFLYGSSSNIFSFAEGLHFPDQFKRCHSATHLENNPCLKEAIQDGLAALKNGLPSFHLPRLDPIDIPSMTIGQGTGTVHVVQNYRNIQLYGCSTARIDKVEFMRGKDGNKMIMDGFIKELRLEADYDMNGKILILPLVGKGKCTVRLANVTSHLTIHTKHHIKNKTLYTHIEDFIVKLAPRKVEYNFENLFGGNEVLGKQMNDILNDQWDAVFSDVQAGYEEAFGKIFKNLANIVYDKGPLDDLHPL